MPNARMHLWSCPQPGWHQQGAALAVSILILLILTVIGIAAMSSGLMAERMAANSQEKILTFNLAESAGNAVINNFARDPSALEPVFEVADFSALDSHTNAVTFWISPEGDLATSSKELDPDQVMQGSAEVIYRGCRQPAARCPGSSLVTDGGSRPGCHHLEVSSSGNLKDNSVSRTVIDRKVIYRWRCP